MPGTYDDGTVEDFLSDIDLDINDDDFDDDLDDDLGLGDRASRRRRRRRRGRRQRRRQRRSRREGESTDAQDAGDNVRLSIVNRRQDKSVYVVVRNEDNERVVRETIEARHRLRADLPPGMYRITETVQPFEFELVLGHRAYVPLGQ